MNVMNTWCQDLVGLYMSTSRNKVTSKKSQKASAEQGSYSNKDLCSDLDLVTGF